MYTRILLHTGTLVQVVWMYDFVYCIMNCVLYVHAPTSPQICVQNLSLSGGEGQVPTLKEHHIIWFELCA